MFTLTLSHSHTPTHSFTRTHSHTLTHTHSLTYTYSHVHLHTHIHIASILRVPFVSLTLHLGYDVTSCHFGPLAFRLLTEPSSLRRTCPLTHSLPRAVEDLLNACSISSGLFSCLFSVLCFLCLVEVNTTASHTLQ